MKPSTAVRHRLVAVLTLGLAALAACAQAAAETRPEQIQVRFDYAGARTLFAALNRPDLSSQDIAELYEVQGLAAMVDNVTRFIPEVFFERYVEICKRDASIRNRFSSGTEAWIAEGPKPAGVP